MPDWDFSRNNEPKSKKLSLSFVSKNDMFSNF